MFERYTEKARRCIFFARYEASQYGSPFIEAEHLLLGILREVNDLSRWFPGKKGVEREIRADIERTILPRERISISIEIPLSPECAKALALAAEAADRLGHDSIGPEHLLIGILRIESSQAAQILIARGAKPELVQEHLAKPLSPEHRIKARISPLLKIERFLGGFKGPDARELISLFATNAEFIDVAGKRWNSDEISKGFETLFAPYAKRNASYVVETVLAETNELFVASVLWRNALLASEQRSWMHRMSIVLVPEGDEWKILLAQVTPLLGL
jgi:Clp amino terminal domain, pathogenicity island component